MPQREGPFVPMDTLSRAQRLREEGVIGSQRADGMPYEFQSYWYNLVGQFIKGREVLDAGAGMGYGKRILEAHGAASVECFDLVSLVPWVRVGKIEEYADASFDVVVAMDVIEHVEDDTSFLRRMLRIARTFVFFSTPNWLFHKAVNEHHRREYTPSELVQLVGAACASARIDWRRVHYWAGDENYQITDAGTTLTGADGCCNFGVAIWK